VSWDIFVADFPKDARTLDDIPEGFEGAPLMARSALIERVKDVVPEADFSDPTWGNIEGPDYSIEINVGDEDPVKSFAFHVRGGDLAAGIVAAILERLDLRGVDSGREDGGFFDPESAQDSLRRWRAYRDQVVSGAASSVVATKALPASVPAERPGLLRRLFRRD
jgi:hypothetical protein